MRKRGKKVRSGLCSAVVFLLLGFLCGCGGSKQPSEVADEYWALVGEGKYQEAIQHVAPEAQNQMMLAMSMSQFGSAFGLRVSEVVTTGQSIRGDTATVRYYFCFSDGSTTDTDTIELVKEGRRWKIGLQETESPW